MKIVYKDHKAVANFHNLVTVFVSGESIYATDDCKRIILGKYQSEERAEEVFNLLLAAIIHNSDMYFMPNE